MAGTKKHMKNIASSGGNATKAKYGTSYYAEIANKRWKKNDKKPVQEKMGV